MAKQKPQAQAVNTVFMYLSLAAAALLIAIGGLAYWGHSFASNMVKTELAAQKIYFPAKGSPALDPAKYPQLQKYAGQLVDTPEEAKAYANDYIGSHLKNIADGKVYAEVSAEAQKDPTNQKLQQQRQSLFMGETLRGILLGTGYAFGTLGKIAGIASVVCFVAAAGLLLAALLFRSRR